LTLKPLSREELFRKYPPAPGAVVRQAWLETLNADSTGRSGELVSLHPAVWSVRPRVDIIKENVDWQMKYKTVSYVNTRGRYELPGGSKRPWPQKGTGRARHASIRSPLWVQGGKAHGPKNPRSYFYMIDYHSRVQGLIHTLSVKFAQDDVHIVSDLEIPTNEAKYVEDLVDERG
jgi:large subunit ribosomal protein L4